VKRVSAVILLLLMPAIIFASSEGTAAAVFLKVPAGARPAGMGSAFTGIGDDINSLYWNPAGITSVETIEFMGTYSQVFEDVTSMYTGIILPIGKTRIGVAVTYLSMGDIEIRDSGGNLMSDSSKIYDMATGITYAFGNERMSLGITGKTITSNLGNYVGTGMAFDLGVLLKFSPKLSAGFDIQNLGGKIKYDTANNDLPMTIKVGFGYRFTESILAALDIDSPKDGGMKIHTGGEVALGKSFIVRAGYDQIDNSINFEKGVTFGFSFLPKFNSGGGDDFDMESAVSESNAPNVRIDYALTSLSAELGVTNRVSVYLKF